MLNSDSRNNGNNHSNKADQDEHFVDLCGWDIKRVNNGLDEAQVGSIITELVSQRDALAEKTEHLSSLTKLAEKTVAEADEFAKQVKTEAIESAEAEKTAMLAHIEEQTQQLLGENERVRVELRKAVDNISRELMALPESFNKELMNSWAECENRLNDLVIAHRDQSVSETQDATIDSEKPASTV